MEGGRRKRLKGGVGILLQMGSPEVHLYLVNKKQNFKCIHKLRGKKIDKVKIGRRGREKWRELDTQQQNIATVEKPGESNTQTAISFAHLQGGPGNKDA